MRLWTTLLISSIFITKILGDKTQNTNEARLKEKEELCPCLPLNLCPQSYQHHLHRRNNAQKCNENEVTCCSDKDFKSITLSKEEDEERKPSTEEISEAESMKHFVTVEIRNLTHSIKFNESFNPSAQVDNTQIKQKINLTSGEKIDKMYQLNNMNATGNIIKIIYSEPYNETKKMDQEDVILVFPVEENKKILRNTNKTVEDVKKEKQEVVSNEEAKEVAQEESKTIRNLRRKMNENTKDQDQDQVQAGSENVDDVKESKASRARLPSRRFMPQKNRNLQNQESSAVSEKSVSKKIGEQEKNETQTDNEKEKRKLTRSSILERSRRKHIQGKLSSNSTQAEDRPKRKMSILQVESMLMENVLMDRQRIMKRMLKKKDNEQSKVEKMDSREVSPRRNYRRNRPSNKNRQKVIEEEILESSTKSNRSKNHRNRKLKNDENKEKEIVEEKQAQRNRHSITDILSSQMDCKGSNPLCYDTSVDLLKEGTDNQPQMVQFVPPERMESGFVPIIGPLPTQFRIQPRDVEGRLTQDNIFQSELQLPEQNKQVSGFSSNFENSNPESPPNFPQLFTPNLEQTGRSNYEENIQRYYEALQLYEKYVNRYLHLRELLNSKEN